MMSTFVLATSQYFQYIRTKRPYWHFPSHYKVERQASKVFNQDFSLNGGRCERKSSSNDETEAAVGICSSKQVFLKFCNIHWKTPVLASFLMLKRDFNTYVSCEYCKIFKNSCSYKTPMKVIFNSFQPNAAFHIKKTSHFIFI